MASDEEKQMKHENAGWKESLESVFVYQMVAKGIADKKESTTRD